MHALSATPTRAWALTTGPVLRVHHHAQYLGRASACEAALCGFGSLLLTPDALLFDMLGWPTRLRIPRSAIITTSAPWPWLRVVFWDDDGSVDCADWQLHDARAWARALP